MSLEQTFSIIQNPYLKYPDFSEDTHYFVKIDHFLELKKNIEKNELEGKKLLSLSDSTKKTIALVDGSFFPFMFQNLPNIFLFFSRIKNREFNFYFYVFNNNKDWKKINIFFRKYLSDLNINFKSLNEEDFDVIEINNFLVLQNDFNPIKAKTINSKTKKYLKEPKVIPYRKVFVARNKRVDQRIDSDKEIKNFFVSAGFEVIYPEQFKTFIDQINYFSECKVIAGISGSALANCIFMKPGGTVIELTSFFEPLADSYPKEFHHYYRMIASSMGHLYFAVSNLSAKYVNIINNKKALEIIKML
jgi:hypothetical protein